MMRLQLNRGVGRQRRAVARLDVSWDLGCEGSASMTTASDGEVWRSGSGARADRDSALVVPRDRSGAHGPWKNDPVGPRRVARSDPNPGVCAPGSADDPRASYCRCSPASPRTGRVPSNTRWSRRGLHGDGLRPHSIGCPRCSTSTLGGSKLTVARCNGSSR